jgi:hypothetical protein
MSSASGIFVEAFILVAPDSGGGIFRFRCILNNEKGCTGGKIIVRKYSKSSPLGSFSASLIIVDLLFKVLR